MFRKYATNLPEKTHAEVQFQYYFNNFIDIALWHGCSLVNALHIFRTHLVDYFCKLQNFCCHYGKIAQSYLPNVSKCNTKIQIIRGKDRGL